MRVSVVKAVRRKMVDVRQKTHGAQHIHATDLLALSFKLSLAFAWLAVVGAVFAPLPLAVFVVVAAVDVVAVAIEVDCVTVMSSDLDDLRPSLATAVVVVPAAVVATDD